MFIGHFGVAFGSKRIDPKPSLGTFFLASQFIDLIWPIFLLLGIERVNIEPGNTAFTPLDFIYYPFTHSFMGVLIWGVLFGFVYYLLKKNWKSSVILGLLVVSHWILDLITHRPDLPLTLWDSSKVGFGLWNSVVLSILVEVLIFSTGVYLYSMVTGAKNKKGIYSYWGLVIFLFVIYVMNVFGDPPPSPEPVALIGLTQWLLVAWAYWIDRNRKNKI